MVSTIWLCVGCQADPAERPAFDLIDPVPIWTQGELLFETGLRWEPGQAMIEALEHGVMIPLELSVRISRHHGLIASEDRTHHHRFEVRYLPLLQDYELIDVRADSRTLYPRLGILVESLAERRQFTTGLTRSEVDERRWQVQLRAHLDRTRLPSPMRLPVWFDDRWRAQSPWYSWIMPLEGGRDQ